MIDSFEEEDLTDSNVLPGTGSISKSLGTVRPNTEKQGIWPMKNDSYERASQAMLRLWLVSTRILPEFRKLGEDISTDFA